MKILKYLLALVFLFVIVKLTGFAILETLSDYRTGDGKETDFGLTNNLRELGVNVYSVRIESNGARKIVVDYEPQFRGGDNEMLMDYGIIIGYIYAEKDFDVLIINNYFDGYEVLTVYISYSAIYSYIHGEMSVDDFKESWEVYT
ncbi:MULTISPECIES: hypothetical protein [unclassified Archaeoglobus]|jgi:hypothetical protein|uniref:hypothetical protein n=1 Tax=unclassified Archaeoglobus TaxID=2643606 RepID=UPI0025C2EC1D|nr:MULTISPECIES: hypothetical protein [unclassified Archaeoglobus]